MIQMLFYICIIKDIEKHMNKRLILLFTLILLSTTATSLLAQKNITYEEYIDTYKDIAVRKMYEYKIPASITLAQGILESGSGNSELARKANNHFGIKCHKEWNGKTFIMDDDEKDECFRKYKSAEDSYRDHSLFLTERERYSDLFTLKITDYKAWAYGLKKAGYATNPKYPQLLIKIIEENNLYAYDSKKLGKASRKKNKIPEEVLDNSTVLEKQVIINGTFYKKGPGDRKIFKNNGVKYILAVEGDNFKSIADLFNIYSYQVYKNNDLEKNDKLFAGQVIYLEKKKSKHKRKIHVAKKNETMYYISQLYGIKLSKLYKHNDMQEGIEPLIGQKVKLR